MRRATDLGAAAIALGRVANDDRAAWALFPGDVAYVRQAGLFRDVVADSLRAS